MDRPTGTVTTFLDESAVGLRGDLVHTAKTQMKVVQAYISVCERPPLDLGETLEDIANEYLRLADDIASRARNLR